MGRNGRLRAWIILDFLWFYICHPFPILVALCMLIVYYYAMFCWIRIEVVTPSVEISGFYPKESVALTHLWSWKLEAVADEKGVIRIEKISFGQWRVTSGGTEELRQRTIRVREYARVFYPKESVSGPVKILYKREPAFGCVFDNIRSSPGVRNQTKLHNHAPCPKEGFNGAYL